jgi:hypothetical protein
LRIGFWFFGGGDHAPRRDISKIQALRPAAYSSHPHGYGGSRSADSQEFAGHAQIQMTMRYVHPTPDHKRRAIGNFEKYVAALDVCPPWELWSPQPQQAVFGLQTESGTKSGGGGWT